MPKKQKKPLSLRFQIMIGVVLMGISGFIYQYNKSFRANAIITQGIVVEVFVSTDSDDGDLSYFPVFEYLAKNGETYRYKSMISTNKKFVIGDSETIYYDKDNPDNARYGESNFNFFSLLPLAIGTIILLRIPISFTIRFIRNAKNDKLKNHGLKISIPPSHVNVIDDYSKEDKTMHKVVGQWYNQETNKVHLFKSKPLDDNPKKELKGQGINVYMNKRKHKKYFVDLSFLNDKSKWIK